MKLVFRALMIFALLPVLAMAYPAECFQMPTAMPLSDRVEQADLVVVARLSSSKMDPLDPHPHPVPIPDGTYGYTVLRVLKGPVVTTIPL
jgi:hypothetical protein